MHTKGEINNTELTILTRTKINATGPKELAVQTIKHHESLIRSIMYQRHTIYRVLHVLSPTQNKSDNASDSFYEELERVFHQYPKY